MRNLLNLAIKAALDAGAEILEIYNDPTSDFGVERKADNSPLTIADKRAHGVITKTLEPSGIYALSEEGRHESYEVRSAHSRLWIIDPLDGTKEFIKRNGEFTVNIALVERGVPVLGVVYLPVKEILYFASQEVGAYRLDNITADSSLPSIDEYITHSAKLPLEKKHDKFTIVASRSHLSDETTAFVEKMREQHGDVEFISSGSSIKLALVAEGSADVYPRYAPTMEWDTAAGDAVARCSGAEVVRHDDEMPLEYNKVDLLNPWFIVRKK
ncbi:MAG: 3'(2'),5'-bisphosphate nucleotidase CysQ [Rikenellaceae bacterium]